MSWQQFTGCRSRRGDDDSASDGDLDIAYALLLADRQWGSAGPIHYREEALKLLAAIKAGEINSPAATVKLGDAQTEGAELNDIRLSDFMPDHFRAFRRATGDPLWDRLLERGYACVSSLQTRYAPRPACSPTSPAARKTATPPRARRSSSRASTTATITTMPAASPGDSASTPSSPAIPAPPPPSGA